MFSSLALLLALLVQDAAPQDAAARRAVPLGAAYDDGNPFARILSGAAPAVVVAETDAALAFMDRAPARPGHVLVIPKSPTVSLLDSTPEQLAGVMALARCVVLAQTAAFTPDGMTGLSLRQNNGAPSQHVGHLHVHLIPTYGDQPTASPTTPTPPEQLEPLAARIRAALPEDC
jgi:histidine triad (HIT) family protein